MRIPRARFRTQVYFNGKTLNEASELPNWKGLTKAPTNPNLLLDLRKDYLIIANTAGTMIGVPVHNITEFSFYLEEIPTEIESRRSKKDE